MLKVFFLFLCILLYSCFLVYNSKLISNFLNHLDEDITFEIIRRVMKSRPSMVSCNK